ncbi:hypothetical protein B9Z55_021884 [Caenorhabditis nigoni]|uniref:Uncharacterized protein n=1 Tax=Caenorhabditis nigoni TaxID=1611254 RepID=A0A2G5TTW6_9PELO|nr:hypothetical protein B9Z55_021884 [Caenorhabditis nigoni]
MPKDGSKQIEASGNCQPTAPSHQNSPANAPVPLPSCQGQGSGQSSSKRAQASLRQPLYHLRARLRLHTFATTDASNDLPFC